MTMFIVRYFWGVSPHFSHTAVVFFGLACFGVWAVTTLPNDVGAAYVPILFCQLFGASSGFRPAADEGRFDALLVSGVGRHRIAVTHWVLSAGPGILAWAVVYEAEVGTLGPAVAVGLRPQSIAGLLLVSGVAWAATLPTARFAGGVVWVRATGLLVVSPDGVSWIRGVLTTTPVGGVQTLSAVVALGLCPFLLLVPAIDGVSADPRVVASIGSIALGATVCGVWWVVARDYPGKAVGPSR